MRVLRPRANRPERPIGVNLITSALAFYEHRLVEHVLGHDGAAAQAVGQDRFVVERADRKRPADFGLRQPGDRSERQPGHADRDRLVRAVDPRRPRVVAVLTKHPGPVIETAIEEPAVHHHAGVPGRRQVVRAQRPIDEVEVR